MQNGLNDSKSIKCANWLNADIYTEAGLIWVEETNSIFWVTFAFLIEALNLPLHLEWKCNLLVNCM